MLTNRKHVGFDPASLCSKSPLHSTYLQVDGSLKVYSLSVFSPSSLPVKISKRA